MTNSFKFKNYPQKLMIIILNFQNKGVDEEFKQKSKILFCFLILILRQIRLTIINVNALILIVQSFIVNVFIKIKNALNFVNLQIVKIAMIIQNQEKQHQRKQKLNNNYQNMIMMMYLIDRKCGDVNIKNHNAKKIIVKAISKIKNVHLYVYIRIVLIRKEYRYNLRKRKQFQLIPVEKPTTPINQFIYLQYNQIILNN
ncbi:unnamed protein product [Paramecium sonneborni]|uniref:Transmembrane protein n=1 Tax=Paramecium sonneborni TaxID=65129 RepID=A0A8S1RDU2_9CILI|nr:unnamed protein product [Paramecium sonneborni]